MFEFIKSLFAAKPPEPAVTLEHPRLGVLTHDSGLWSGETQSAGSVIDFCVAGDETAPDARLLDSLSEILARFAEVEREALDFILHCVNDPHDTWPETLRLFRDKPPTVTADDFEFYSLDFFWTDKPQDSVFEFLLDGDVDGVWRVEFEAGRPKWLGRDD